MGGENAIAALLHGVILSPARQQRAEDRGQAPGDTEDQVRCPRAGTTGSGGGAREPRGGGAGPRGTAPRFGQRYLRSHEAVEDHVVAETGAHAEGQAEEQGAEAERHEETGRDGGSEQSREPGGHQGNENERRLQHGPDRYGRIPWVEGPGVRRGAARLANSQSRGRVSRGSMISSIQKASAERKASAAC